jgi:hypothetical protein
MKTSFARRATLSAAFLGVINLAQAHPGHDDGHELTWDLGHLVAFPVATLLCLAVFGVAVWGASQLVRRRTAAAVQSLRGSQASLGK